MIKSILSKAKSFGTGSKDNKKTAGIGIVFQVGPDRAMYIAEISPGGAAEDCKLLRKGDCLMSVDGKDTFQLDYTTVSSYVMGKFGS